MRRARILLVLLLFVVGALGFFGLRSGWFETERSGPDRTVAEAPGADAKTETAKQENVLSRPTFDIVRAEPDGSIIMAGQSKPGSTVIVQSNGKEVGRATADENGEWIIQPDAKLAKGEHSLELSAKSPKEDRTVFSRQRLALSLADAKAGQPLVALTEEGKATRVLQMPPQRAENATASASDPSAAQADLAAVKPDAYAAAETANTVGFAAVDYEDAGEKSMIFMNGHAKPDTRVAVYVDNKLAGTATADATGSWSFSGNRRLEGGRHVIRADLLAAEGNSVIARAEVNFERTPSAIALLEDDAKIKGLAGGDPVNLASRSDLAVSAASAAPVGAGQSEEQPRVIVIRRGDTLWQIAQRHYGDGAKYSQIFQNNRDQIRNPNWIYPDQRFKMP
jgi:nucleoid-associated protein YgaU